MTDEADASGAPGWRRQGHVPEAEGPEISGGRQDGWWHRLRAQVVRFSEEEGKRGLTQLQQVHGRAGWKQGHLLRETRIAWKLEE